MDNQHLRLLSANCSRHAKADNTREMEPAFCTQEGDYLLQRYYEDTRSKDIGVLVITNLTRKDFAEFYTYDIGSSQTISSSFVPADNF
jgi:hypothetical protein